MKCLLLFVNSPEKNDIWKNDWWFWHHLHPIAVVFCGDKDAVAVQWGDGGRGEYVRLQHAAGSRHNLINRLFLKLMRKTRHTRRCTAKASVLFCYIFTLHYRGFVKRRQLRSLRPGCRWSFKVGNSFLKSLPRTCSLGLFVFHWSLMAKSRQSSTPQQWSRTMTRSHSAVARLDPAELQGRLYTSINIQEY